MKKEIVKYAIKKNTQNTNKVIHHHIMSIVQAIRDHYTEHFRCQHAPQK